MQLEASWSSGGLGGRDACGKRQPLRSNYKHSDLFSLAAMGIKCFLLSLNGFMQQQIDVEVGLKCNLCAGTQVRVLYVNQLHFHSIVLERKCFTDCNLAAEQKSGAQKTISHEDQDALEVQEEHY